MVLDGIGNGPIDAFKKALVNASLVDTHIVDYAEHSMGKGSEAKAACLCSNEKRKILE